MSQVYTLEELYLSHNGIDDSGCGSIVSRENTTPSGLMALPFSALHTIDLSRNKLSSCQPFQTCYSLEDLWLSGNFIQHFDHINPIAELPKLTTIYLEYNPIDKDVDYRIKLQKILPHLKQIDAEECYPLPLKKHQQHKNRKISTSLSIIQKELQQRKMKELQDNVIKRAKAEKICNKNCYQIETHTVE